MRFLFYLVTYALSFIPAAMLANFMSETVAAQVISDFEQVLSALEKINAALI
jgi:hypothetical protein